MWPCQDGHASVTLLFGAGFAPFTQNLMQWAFQDGFVDEATRDKDWVGYPGLLMSGAETLDDFEAAKAQVAAWTASKTKQELLQLALDRSLLIAPVSTPRDVVESEQLAAR